MMPTPFVPPTEMPAPHPAKARLGDRGQLIVAGISFFVALLVIGILFVVLDRATASLLVLSSIVIVPLASLLGGGLAFVFTRLFPASLHSLALTIATILSLTIILAFGWSFISDHNKSPDVQIQQAASAAQSIADCSNLLEDSGYWNGCVSKFVKTEADFQTCLTQASQLVSQQFTDLSSGTCGLAYALATNNVAVCFGLADAENRSYCQSQYQLITNK